MEFGEKTQSKGYYITDIPLMAEVDSRPDHKLKSNTPLGVFRLLERGRTSAPLNSSNRPTHMVTYV